MTMYLINVALLIVYAAVLLWIRPTPAKRKAFCVMSAGNWVLLSALRHLTIGADTYTYYYAFHNSKYHTWEQLFKNFRNTLFNWNLYEESVMYAGEETSSVFSLLVGENALAVKDPGYAILCKAFYTIWPNYTAFLFFVAIVFMFAYAMLVYRHSNEPLLSFLIYSCLFYSFFSLTGIRQTIATAVALVGFLEFGRKKKFVPFLLMVLMVYPIHKSIVAFIPIYFLQFIKMDRKKIIFAMFLFPVIFVLRQPIASFLASLSGYETYERQIGTGASTFTLIYVFLMLVVLWKEKALLKDKEENHWEVAAVVLAFLLTPLTFVNTNLMRIVQYYSIFIVLLIPNLILSFEKDECVFAYFFAVSALLILGFKGNPQYLFFWQ